MYNINQCTDLDLEHSAEEGESYPLQKSEFVTEYLNEIEDEGKKHE